ncbi:thioesterase domain-containing protein [Vallitalea sediminicola]
MILYCVPHAGSSALNYYQWKIHMTDNIRIVPLELAGRGAKSDQALYSCFDEAVDDLVEDIINYQSDDEEYALFGHSLGCWLVYHVYFRLIKKGMKPPVHIFFSGRWSPLTEKEELNYRDMTDQEFMNRIKEIGGTSEKIINSTEFLDKYLKIFRSDFAIIEEYQNPTENELIESDITILSGTEDSSIKNSELLEWRKTTSGMCTICKINGGHFFHLENMKDTINVIVNKLEG